VYEVLRWAEIIQPEWIACEQVPFVLAVWKQFAHVLEEHGYYTWTGELNAADFGTPQIRKRAVLMAAKHPFHPPEPTHAEDPSALGFLGELQPWVTMAGGLAAAGLEGWGPNDVVHERLNTGRDWKDGESAQTIDPDDQPAPAFTAKSGSQWMLHGGGWALHNRLYDPEAEPSPTVMFGHDAANWCWTRPATTVACDPRIQPPGHKQNSNDPPGRYENRAGENAVRVTVPEAAVLQGFPPNYPFQGSLTEQFRQIGNAIPSQLAAAIVKQLI
jgi:DNA (cytosine-5)-methyltransferase 1